MAVVKEKDFPELVELYNTEGRTALYDHIRSQYGLKQPYYVLRRIMKSSRYDYDKEQDLFRDTAQSDAEQADLFFSLDQLCRTEPVPVTVSEQERQKERSKAMEALVQTLIGDRLLELSRYVMLDPVSRRVRVDKVSLEQNGYYLEIL